MEFLDLESVYEHLEERALDYKYLHQIANVFQKVRDEMHKKQNVEEEKKAQWEIDVFNFSIKENKIHPLHIKTNDKGEKVKYPTYDRFDNFTYDYIIKRLNSTSHPLLKARYAHILWFSPKKHGKYSQIAIDAYLELIKLYEEKDKAKPKEHFGLDILNAISNAFFLSLNSNDEKKLNRAKSKIKRLIFDFNSESSSFFALRARLTSLMLNQKNTFSKDDFVGMDKMCHKFAEILQDSHKAITMLELGEKIDEKLGIKRDYWKKSIAERYEKMMKSTQKTNKFVAIKFCQDDLKHYRQLKDAKKIEELQKIYDELKDKVEFKEFKMEINLKQYIESCEKKAKKIAQHSPEDILRLLAVDKNLLPKHKEMKTFAEQLLNEHPLQGIFPTQVVDERGHNVEHFSSKEEIVFFQMLRQYGLHLENQYLPLINAILFEALKEKKITFDSLMSFFKKYSWFGKPLKKRIQNREIAYNWMNLLAPPLSEYFRQMEFSISAREYPNLVLCIDSLILKIEGLLRDLCNYSGITTFFQTEDKQGRTVYREKDLNALLHEEKIRKLFDEDDLLFFRYVLVEKMGYNLRHKIAHSLIVFGEYRINFIHLLILMLLRIGKFDFRKKAYDSSVETENGAKNNMTS